MYDQKIIMNSTIISTSCILFTHNIFPDDYQQQQKNIFPNYIFISNRPIFNTHVQLKLVVCVHNFPYVTGKV